MVDVGVGQLHPVPNQEATTPLSVLVTKCNDENIVIDYAPSLVLGLFRNSVDSFMRHSVVLSSLFY